jgi:hypothetical protein
MSRIGMGSQRFREMGVGGQEGKGKTPLEMDAGAVLEERFAVQGGKSIFVLRKLVKKARPTRIPRSGVSSSSAAGAGGRREREVIRLCQAVDKE